MQVRTKPYVELAGKRLSGFDAVLATRSEILVDGLAELTPKPIDVGGFKRGLIFRQESFSFFETAFHFD